MEGGGKQRECSWRAQDWRPQRWRQALAAGWPWRRSAAGCTAQGSPRLPRGRPPPPCCRAPEEDDRALLRRQRAALRLLGELTAARVIAEASPLLGVLRELVGPGAGGRGAGRYLSAAVQFRGAGAACLCPCSDLNPPRPPKIAPTPGGGRLQKRPRRRHVGGRTARGLRQGNRAAAAGRAARGAARRGRGARAAGYHARRRGGRRCRAVGGGRRGRRRSRSGGRRRRGGGRAAARRRGGGRRRGGRGAARRPDRRRARLAAARARARLRLGGRGGARARAWGPGPRLLPRQPSTYSLCGLPAHPNHLPGSLPASCPRRSAHTTPIPTPLHPSWWRPTRGCWSWSATTPRRSRRAASWRRARAASMRRGAR
jgi:hypothetical protein